MRRIVNRKGGLMRSRPDPKNYGMIQTELPLTGGAAGRGRTVESGIPYPSSDAPRPATWPDDWGWPMSGAPLPRVAKGKERS
jgi:hypothetical protein